MNIQFQLCGLCILILLIIFYKSHNTLQLYKEKVFYAVMCIITISLAGDILSIFAIQYRHMIPAPIVYFICKSYVITLILGSLSALIYVMSDLYSEPKHRKIIKRLVGVFLLQSIIVYLLPIYIYTDETQMYTYGPSVLGVYAFVAINIITTLAITVICRKRMNRRRSASIFLWMIIWMGSAVIQFFNNALLIVGFASALGVLILFVVIENPEATLERKLGCFNSYALTEYVKQLYERKQHFSVLEIYFKKPDFLVEQELDTNEVFRKILESVQDDVKTFKNINLSLVLISETAEKLQAAVNSILDAFSDIEGFRKSTSMILASDTTAFEDVDELVRFLQFVQTKYKDTKETLIITDEKMIEEYKSKYLIEQQITEALTENRVEIFLQPIYSNQDHRFTSAEALVRIRKKDGRLLSPALFIPVAENNGQILELGERVFEEVCKFLKNTALSELGVHYIEVNLSVVQCEKKDLADRLISITEKYGVDPKMINLEITESGSIGAQKVLLENMQELIKYGFTFSLDDFGKGQSNLMYLVEMPVSIVKLDYDMMKVFSNSLKAQQVVRAVLSMAHNMNMKVVAEGVESEEETNQMRQEGVDYIQGFYYSKPLPLNEYLQFIMNKG